MIYTEIIYWIVNTHCSASVLNKNTHTHSWPDFTHKDMYIRAYQEFWLATPKIHWKQISIYTTIGSARSLYLEPLIQLLFEWWKKRYFHNSFIYVRRRSWASVCEHDHQFFGTRSLQRRERKKKKIFDHSTANDRDDTTEWPRIRTLEGSQIFFTSSSASRCYYCCCCWQQYRTHSFIHISCSHSTNDTDLSVVFFFLIYIFMFNRERKTWTK